MFTGLVEEVGEVRALERAAGSTRLSIRAHTARAGLALGDSVAVDGACLTVIALDPDGFWIGLSPETLQRTNLGERQVGDRVNLERSLQVGGRLGGHYVQGHVDGVGRVVETRPEGDSLRVWFTAPPDLMRYIVVKGYICLDGVSLTVTEKDRDRFGVALVAYTQTKITMPTKPVGSTVNIEVDVMAKYVESLLEGHVERDRERTG
ncbi:MAG: riboflavin synthase [Chloroflexi bacterium]|nr:riboflavin synthase [Chloroflexota bacterium]